VTTHVIFYVADQARARDFFSAVLGRTPRLDVPGMTELELPGGAVLGLMPESGIRRLLGDALPHFSWRRATRAELYLLVDDVAAAHARALAAGAEELSAPARRSWGHWVGYSLDADGHVLAFASDAESAEPPDVSVSPAAPTDHPACERVLRSLPAWFGIESALMAYVQRLPDLRVLVARSHDEVVGFIGVEQHTERAAEIHVMAVAPGHHRRGIGRLLVGRASRELQASGVEYLQVKTLAPSREDASYEKTRAFYAALGFVPLEEHPTLWGPENPALQMVKRL
jgi:uncharacterized protein